MKNIFLTVLLGTLFAVNANASTTLFQCATDNVRAGGVRVNVLKSNNSLDRANVIFGTTVSGTMYVVGQTPTGYEGYINGKPEFTFKLVISQSGNINSNIDGYESELTVIYPTFQNAAGYKVVKTNLVCGKKITDRWN
jgi:hypothetical protein